MSDMEEIIARAIRDTHGTPADITQALTSAGYGRVDVAPASGDASRSDPRDAAGRDELVEAARDVLSLHAQPGETPTASFDRQASAFYRNTGFMRPGKSVSREMDEMVTEEERWAAWNEWCLAKYTRLRAALSLPRKTEADIRADERERLARMADMDRPAKVFWGDGYDCTGRSTASPLSDWLRSHTQGEG